MTTTQSIRRGIADELTERILTEFRHQIHSIVLFGSVARGDDNDESDIDILVISDAPLEVQDRVSELRTDLFLVNLIVIQFVWYTSSEWDDQVYLRPWFIIDVIQQGVVLYDDGTFRKGVEKAYTAIGGVPSRQPGQPRARKSPNSRRSRILRNPSRRSCPTDTLWHTPTEVSQRSS